MIGIRKKKKIVFVCRYSTQEIRDRLSLSSFRINNFIARLIGVKAAVYCDPAIWFSDYISELNKFNDSFELHVVSPHQGLLSIYQEISLDGIHFHFYRADQKSLISILAEKIRFHEIFNHKIYRYRFVHLCKSISPDLILLCGAENPDYSYGILDMPAVPKMVILQTFLNDPKRIKLKIGNKYRRKKESDIFKTAQSFITKDLSAIRYIKIINPEANIIEVPFMTHQPRIKDKIKKEYDFVFFASQITEAKGLLDLLVALTKVVESNTNTSLLIIGGFTNQKYSDIIHTYVDEHGLKDNVTFLGRLPNVSAVYDNVQRAKCSVVPGITSLNCTVRESMFLKMPTIIYEIPAADPLKSEENCICMATLRDTNDLAKKMLKVMEDVSYATSLSEQGFIYATNSFGNEVIANKIIIEINKVLYENYEIQ